MTRPPQRLSDSVEVTRITPRVATTLLIKGLLPPEDAATFKPTNLTAEAIIRLLHDVNEVRNRPVSLPFVYKLSRDMSNGNWQWTGDPIQLDTDGFVRNGQHRLLAIVHSKTTHDMIVVRDVDPAAQLVMDTGRARTVANQMHLFGVRNSTIATATANLIIRWRANKLMLSSYVPSVTEVHNLITSEDEMPAAMEMVNTIRRHMKRAPLSSMAAVYVEAGHVDKDARNEFFDKLVTGANLAVDDPILVLRATLGRQLMHNVRSRRAGQLYQIVHAWNLWRRDETARIIRVPSTLTSDTFPKVR